MTTTERTGTTCDSCRVRYYTDTMHNIDTAPECGDCMNDRLAPYIKIHWTGAVESSEEFDCAHDDVEYGPEGMTCIECGFVTADWDDLRDDFESDRADAIRKGEW